MKVAIDTLGCKLNQAESEALARQLAEAGHTVVSPSDEADVCILNTCTVTHTADAKARHWLRLAHRRNSRALVVAVGCYAQRAPQELAQIEGVSLVLGNNEKTHLLRLIEEAGGLSSPTSRQEVSASDYYPPSRTRAFVKVQDGCSSFCSYCIVPLVRRAEQSLPVEQVAAEVRQRAASGYKEVVLTGTKVGSYHHDSVGIKGLLEHILVGTDVRRLRLSSLQPQEISPELIGLWRDRRLCPHFHLSLQSGSDGVLRRMKRHYSASDYQKAVSLIRELVPGAAITTDIIVGFPGETDDEFEESYHFCQQMAFARIHVFPYSARSGTLAARLPHQINALVKKERSQRLLILHNDSVRNFSQQFLGEVRPVLWEKRNDGIWSGLTDNYIKVYTKSDEDLTNRLLPVKLERIRADGAWGEIIDTECNHREEVHHRCLSYGEKEGN